jgi:23S rRNA (pseudouridine1915-N3)-methyltransferase
MRLTIAAVGENKSGYLREGESDYLGRLGHYCHPKILSVPGVRMVRTLSEESVRGREWRNMLTRLPERRYLILLDRKGIMLSSEQLAAKIQNLQNRSVADLCFGVGGPAGFPREALSVADFVLSLSAMTFTHEMTRLILMEQLYRAFTILKNEKYHK